MGISIEDTISLFFDRYDTPEKIDYDDLISYLSYNHILYDEYAIVSRYVQVKIEFPQYRQLHKSYVKLKWFNHIIEDEEFEW
jgi:hypothetical protein